jgi:transaldolase
MNNLTKLHADFNQSPWLDNLSRDLIESGQLEQYIAQGVRGITSNPTIIEKAITHSNLYDEQIGQLHKGGLTSEQIYWTIVEDDIKAAAKLLRPVWEQSEGVDGYVSLEVSPRLAEDTESTVAQARQIWKDINMPNLMVKIPATDKCIPAIHTLLGEGININVTLIFSLEHYEQVVTANLATHQDGVINNARSVASFFVSRVDTEVDKRLTKIGTNEALALRGKTGIAQARLAYKIFLEKIAPIALHSPTSTGIQRLLWASTSTKNPDYDDLLYVTNLVAPYTINTLPEDTVAKIEDHLPPMARSLTISDIADAQEVFTKVTKAGVDINDVSRTLESEGIEKFHASFDSLLKSLDTKKQQIARPAA